MALGKDGYIQLFQEVDDNGNPVGPDVSEGAWASATKTVAVPGTAEQCGALVAPAGKGIVFKAKDSNTDMVYLGNSKANAESSSVRFGLAAGQSLILIITNANLVWVDAVVAAEGLDIAVEQ